jgi:hypothetical protein
MAATRAAYTCTRKSAPNSAAINVTPMTLPTIENHWTKLAKESPPLRISVASVSKTPHTTDADRQELLQERPFLLKVRAMNTQLNRGKRALITFIFRRPVT